MKTAHLWATQPMYLPRWGLLAKYLAVAAVGLIGILEGVRTLDLTTPHGYPLIWAGCIVVLSMLAFAGVAVRRLEHLETIAIPMLLSFIAVLILTTTSPIFQAFLVAVTTVPISRLPYLLRRLWHRVVQWFLHRRRV